MSKNTDPGPWALGENLKLPHTLAEPDEPLFYREPDSLFDRERHAAASPQNPFLAVDDIPDNFDLVPRSKPSVWVLPAAIVAVVVIVSVYAALFRWVL